MPRPSHEFVQLHVKGVGRQLRHLVKPAKHSRGVVGRLLVLALGLLVIGGSMAVTLGWAARRPAWAPPGGRLLDTLLPRETDLTLPVREAPRRFPARSHLPARNEMHTCGGIAGHFFAQHDLVHVSEDRVWWESDQDENDTEDDHLFHRALEEPFRRLVELVSREGGVLKVQDTFREEGIHAAQSLHKEGRAVDLTCDELGLERLAKLAWMAGFDWVYHESPRGGGAHVHASVRANRPGLARNDR